MSEVKRIRGGLIRGVLKNDNGTSIFDGEFIDANHNEIFNTKRVHSRKLRNVSNRRDNIGFNQNNMKIAREGIPFAGEQEIFSGEKLPYIGARRIRDGEFNREEQELDREVENCDTFSVSIMILILIICFVVGILLGYLLYRLAIDSSAVIMIKNGFLL